jgi:UDP-glucose 4-epimerase
MIGGTTLKILVTGGAGFIGSHLSEYMLKKGHEVVVLDDFSSGGAINIRHLLDHRSFKLVRGDIRNYDLVRRVTTNLDVVFHLAAKIHVDESIINPEETLSVNVKGTLNILNACKENDVKRLIYASSSEVYGSSKYTPMDEDHPLNPASPYAASKAAADRLCFSYYNTYNLDAVIVRNFNTFGPGQKSSGYGGAISIFIRRALKDMPPIIYGDGLQTRDYLYVEDAVNAYNLVMETPELAGEAINFGTGVDTSITDIAEKILRLMGKEEKLIPRHVASRPGEVRQLCADITKAKRLLNFKPTYTLEEGLKELIKWHEDYRFEEWRWG